MMIGLGGIEMDSCVYCLGKYGLICIKETDLEYMHSINVNGCKRRGRQSHRRCRFCILRRNNGQSDPLLIISASNTFQKYILRFEWFP